jgi:hypothetical protein
MLLVAGVLLVFNTVGVVLTAISVFVGVVGLISLLRGISSMTNDRDVL